MIDMSNKELINDKKNASLNNWREHPYNRETFSNIKSILPSERINKGNKSHQFNLELEDLDKLIFKDKYNDEIYLDDYLNQSLADSFLVLKDGNIIFEWFHKKNLKESQHILFSVSKSLTAILTETLHEMKVLNIESNITHYIPEVQKSAYKGATIRNLLDMTVSSNFKENFLDRSGLFNEYRMATGFNPSDGKDNYGIHKFLCNLPSSRQEHGIKFHYCSPHTDMLGWIIEKTTQRRFSEVFSELLFQKCYPNNEAYITLDPFNSPRTAGGICITIYDLAKIAEMVRCFGCFGKNQILSESKINELISIKNNISWQNNEAVRLFPNGNYRSNWYQTGLKDKELCAIGIHGQWIWINPIRKITIIKLSSRKQPLSLRLDYNFVQLCSAICRELQ